MKSSPHGISNKFGSVISLVFVLLSIQTIYAQSLNQTIITDDGSLALTFNTVIVAEDHNGNEITDESLDGDDDISHIHQ